jgi:hypothetical protein
MIRDQFVDVPAVAAKPTVTTRAPRNQRVTSAPPRNHPSVTNLASAEVRPDGPKRDRAAYMRERRAAAKASQSAAAGAVSLAATLAMVAREHPVAS